MFRIWTENNFNFVTIDDTSWTTPSDSEYSYVSLEEKPAYVFRDNNFLWEVKELPIGLNNWYWGDLDNLGNDVLYVRNPTSIKYAQYKTIISNTENKKIYTTKIIVRNKGSNHIYLKLNVDGAMVLDDYYLDKSELFIDDKIPVENFLKLGASGENVEIIIYGLYK